MNDEIEKDGAPHGLLARHRAAIVTGVISSLLVVYFVDPIFSFLGRLAIDFSKFASATYLDRLYSEVATSEPNFGFFAVMAVAGIALGIGTSAIRGTLRTWPRTREPATSKGRALRMVFLLVFSLFPTFFAVDSYIRLKTASTFNQRLNVIAPEITELERKRFLSKFAAMRGKSDFDQIMSEIEAVALSKGIVLPANLLYPL